MKFFTTIILFLQILYITVNAAPWTKLALSNGSSFLTVVFGNNCFITADYYSGKIYKSTNNGQTWELKATLAVMPSYITYGNGKFVLTDSNNGEYVFVSDTDGDTWQGHQVGSDNNFGTNGIVYGNSGFVTVSSNGINTHIFVSGDGSSWTRVFNNKDPLTNSDLTLIDAAFGNGTYVVVGSAQGGRIFTSTNTTAWTLRTIPIYDQIMGVAYANGLFVAVGGSGNIIVSSDNGQSWGSSPVYNAGRALNAVTYGGGYFYAVGSGGIIVKSSDGINWSTEESGVTSELSDITFGNGYFIASGYPNTILVKQDVLPVELSSFTANEINTGVELKWSTATEQNNNKFIIERLTECKAEGSKDWETVGEVLGSGNSNSVKNYSYLDKTVISGIYAYRLKQIDNDGTYKYSSEVRVDLGTPESFAVAQNFPNPFNPSTVINYKLPAASSVELKVYDILGKEVATLVNEKQEAGSYNVTFDTHKLQLPSGMYIAKLNAGSYSKSIKMSLIK